MHVSFLQLEVKSDFFAYNQLQNMQNFDENTKQTSNLFHVWTETNGPTSQVWAKRWL